VKCAANDKTLHNTREDLQINLGRKNLVPHFIIYRFSMYAYRRKMACLDENGP